MQTASKESILVTLVPSSGNCHKANLVVLYSSFAVQVHSNSMQDIHEIWQILQKAIQAKGRTSQFMQSNPDSKAS